MEDESEDKEEIAEDEPSDLEPAWEGSEMGKNADPKIIETSHDLRILQAKSPMYDLYLARDEVSIEAGNYPLAVKDLKNVVPEQRDRPKNQSGKMVTNLQGRTDSIMDRTNRENSQDLESSEEARVEVRKRPSIIIGIQFDRLGKTLAQFHTRFKSHCSSKLGKQGESGSKDSQAEFLHIRTSPAPPQGPLAPPPSNPPRTVPPAPPHRYRTLHVTTQAQVPCPLHGQ